MKKNKDKKIIALFIITGVLLFILLFIKIYFDFFNNDTGKEKIDSIGFYGYSLQKSDTKIYETYYKELSDTLNQDSVDYNNYAKLISKLFLIDLFTLDNKLGSTDIGGLEFLHKDLRDNFKENMGNGMYSFVKMNLDGERKQELPIVKDVMIDDVFETKYTYNKVEYPSYLITATIEYEKDLGYQKNIKLTIIKDDKILYVVKGE